MYDGLLEELEYGLVYDGLLRGLKDGRLYGSANTDSGTIGTRTKAAARSSRVTVFILAGMMFIVF